MERVDGIFRMAVNILNSRIDGRYIYGGTRTDVPPVNVDTLAELLAAPAVADVFDNNQTKPAMQIDEGETMEFGVLASDLGTQLFTAIRNIAQFHAGAGGPFDDDLTAAQRTFLEGELPNIIAAAEGLTLEAAKNGVHQNEVTDALERHDASKVVIKSMISDIEDVDMAEAITRLNQNQVAAQATAKLLAELNQLTLLNFLE
jgi:flagellar hook-associated protein 3 FlgL